MFNFFFKFNFQLYIHNDVFEYILIKRIYLYTHTHKRHRKMWMNRSPACKKYTNKIHISNVFTTSSYDDPNPFKICRSHSFQNFNTKPCNQMNNSQQWSHNNYRRIKLETLKILFAWYRFINNNLSLSNFVRSHDTQVWNKNWWILSTIRLASPHISFRYM